MIKEKLPNNIKLLVITPHFKYFIKDQIAAISPFLKKTNILIPINRFSYLIRYLPVIRDQFSYGKDGIESFNTKFKYKDVNIYRLPYLSLPLNLYRKRNHRIIEQKIINNLYINKENPNLIHAHFLGTTGYIGAILKEKYGVPLIITGHGGDVYGSPFKEKWSQDIAKYTMNVADQIIAVSQFNANKMISLGVSSHKIHVIPNGYNENLFKPISLYDARKKLNIPMNKKVLLTVGSLDEVKGHTYLIDAMHIILKKQQNVLLIIVGSGPLKPNLYQKIKILGLTEKILLVGRRRHEEIPLWMNACDLFILPSLNEGFPTVISEALACSKPVIATRVGGIPEAISNNNVGIVIDPRDPKLLALAILEALDRIWNPEEISNYAKQYSWKNLGQQILKVYDAALMR